MNTSVSATVNIIASAGLVVNPTSMDFGGLKAGESATRAFDIGTNDGSEVFGLVIDIAGTPPGDVSFAYFVSSNPVPGDHIPAFSQLHVEVTLTASPAASAGGYSFSVVASA